MTTIQSLLLMLVTFVGLGSWLHAQDPGLPTAAVVGFTASPGVRLPGFRENLQEVLTIGLAQTGQFRVLERAKLDAVLGEQALSMTGLADDQQSLVRVGKLLGADYLLTGNLLNLDTQANTFNGYGVVTTTTTYTLRLSAKLIETNSGQVVYGDVFTVQKNDRQFSASNGADTGIQHQLLNECGARLVSKIEAYAAQHRAELARKRDESQLIEVRFESEPAGASILVDGLVIGNTPFTYKTTGGVHRVALSKPGFVPWEQMTRLTHGQRISTTLQKPPEKKPDVVIIIP